MIFIHACTSLISRVHACEKNHYYSSQYVTKFSSSNAFQHKDYYFEACDVNINLIFQFFVQTQTLIEVYQ